jgi:hypothetical protein
MHRMISIIILLAASSFSISAQSQPGKELVCHKGKEISVSNSAITGHMNHGDTAGECGDDSSSPPPMPEETDSAVVIMRCDAGVVVSITTSLEVAVILPVPLEEGAHCATALAEFLDAGFTIDSITGGSVGESLYTDYLLLGQVPVDS